MGLALVTAHYGGYSKLRRTSVLRALADWEKQDAKPDEGVFLELVCPGQGACFDDIDMPRWLKYIRIYGAERNANLFQKEALWNLGAKLVSQDKLLFIDNDCSPVDTTSYFEDLERACSRGVLVHCACRLIHEKFADDGSDQIRYSIAMSDSPHPDGCVLFPGIGYVITRYDYIQMDGFNPYGITGAGDAIFLYEACGIPITWTGILRYFAAIKRHDVPRLQLTCVKGMTMRHNYHGGRDTRAYNYSRKIVDVFGNPKSYVHMDNNGLLAWNDPKCLQAAVLMKKTEMGTLQSTLNLITSEVEHRLKDADENVRLQIDTYEKRDFNSFA